MNAKTEKMLDGLNRAHHWDKRQMYGRNGTQLSSTDTCRICGLQRHYFSDRQNGIFMSVIMLCAVLFILACMISWGCVGARRPGQVRPPRPVPTVRR